MRPFWKMPGKGWSMLLILWKQLLGTGRRWHCFLTELNTGFYSVGFLQEYECERYYQYNQNLLFSEEEREIGRQIEKGMGKM